MSPLLTILALDMSSTAIGVVVADGARVREHATWQLGTRDVDIATRCRRARSLVLNQLALTPPDLVVVESPVNRFAKALIPQARVSGAVLAAVADAGLVWVEVSPTAAKRALTGKGTASKDQVVERARLAFEPADEHQADAYALVIAAHELKIQKVAA